MVFPSLLRLDEVKIYDIFWAKTIASDLVGEAFRIFPGLAVSEIQSHDYPMISP